MLGSNPLHVLHYTFRRFKCGEDDDGYAIKVALKYFWDYMSTQADDSPLYVFDSSYETDRVRAHRSYLPSAAVDSYGCTVEMLTDLLLRQCHSSILHDEISRRCMRQPA